MATNTEQLFQSKHLAAEIEHIWDGAVLSNSEQGLTETEKAQARNNIGAVAFGSQLKILGHVDTAAELEAIVNPKVGDAYSVGVQTPYNLWIFDGLRGSWLDYGQIRATDISSRYIENYSIGTNAWTLDEDVFADYNYKARIVFDAATSDDYPIVAFEVGEASSGNFAPIAFAWNGYLEIFAKSVPNGAINIPVATIIVNGGNGKGITNANGGIAGRGVTANNLADGAIPVVRTISLSEEWTGDESPYKQTVTISGYTVTANSKIDIQPNAEALAQLMEKGVSALYIENNDGTLTAVAVGEKTDAMTLQCTVEEVRT